ncbi:MAG TPA: hypothetical protein DEO85_12880 [Maritimibacter sp.]|nr:hypothetical protein [Maritimibacter sp.]
MNHRARFAECPFSVFEILLVFCSGAAGGSRACADAKALENMGVRGRQGPAGERLFAETFASRHFWRKKGLRKPDPSRKSPFTGGAEANVGTLGRLGTDGLAEKI